jgi:hypothetical protein
MNKPIPLESIGNYPFGKSGYSPEKAPIKETEKDFDSSSYIVVRIVFDLAGDDIGGPEYEEIMDAIREDIKSNEAGEILSSGYDMGNMELVMAIEGDEEMRKIKRIIINRYPEAKYRIEQ